MDPYRDADNYMLILKKRVREDRLNPQSDGTENVRLPTVWNRVVHRIVRNTGYHSRVVTK